MNDSLVHTFPRGEREQIQLAIRKYKGRHYIDIRLWYEPEDQPGSEYKPTRKGVFFSIEQVGELKRGVDRLSQAVDTLGPNDIEEIPERHRKPVGKH